MSYFFVVFTLCVQGSNVCEDHKVLVDVSNELECINIAQAVLAENFREGFVVEKFGCKRG